MTLHRAIFVATCVVSLGLAACSRVPACNDVEVIKQVTASLQEQSKSQLLQRFKIPFLSPAAQQTLVDFYEPDSLGVTEMRTVAIDKDLGQRRCEATAEYRYALDGRLEKAKAALEHGAVTGQTVAYMLEGEPYLSSVRKMSATVKGPLTWTTQRTDDGKIHVDVEQRELPLF